ncbi:unnamed protein product [Rotaria sp. Silwood1]|nr:unnamed protein product [Rotaria sp. Silwood1]
MSFIRAFIDAEYFSTILGTIPAIFAKTSLVWNPLIYVIRNGNIRHYLPFCRNYRFKETNRISDQIRYSTYSFSTDQLLLTSIPSSRRN